MSIYVIRSEIMKRNYHKIGYTTQTRKKLRSCYTRQYGEPEIVYWHNFPDNYKEKERMIFDNLERYRVFNRHEIFKCSFRRIDSILRLHDGRGPKIGCFGF